MKNSNLLSRDEMKALLGGKSAIAACSGQTERGVTCGAQTLDCQMLVCGGPGGLVVGVCCDREPIWGVIDFICWEAVCVDY